MVKVGSSSLTTPDGEIADDRICALAAALAARRAPTPNTQNTQLVLVSSGAIASGLVPLGLSRRPSDLATQQAAASVGQGLLIARYTAAFDRHGIRTGQVLLSADDLMRRTHYRNAQRTLDRLLELGVLPVVNENDTVATDEIRFGDNDRLAALVAHVTRAGALILLSDVDGLYDGDPRRGQAQRITEVRDRADLDGIRLGGGNKAGPGSQGSQKGQGIGGMATKVDAAMIASAAGIPTVVADAASAAAALAGEPAGTYFAAARGRQAGHPAALAQARRGGPRQPAAGPRGGRGGRRQARQPAAGRHHRGRGNLRRRRPGQPPGRGRRDRRPRPGELRRHRGPRPDGPLDQMAGQQAGPRIRTRSSPPRRHGADPGGRPPGAPRCAPRPATVLAVVSRGRGA